MALTEYLIDAISEKMVSEPAQTTQAHALRKLFGAVLAVAVVVWIAAYQLPDNRARLPGACSGDRTTGPNYAEGAFWLAFGLWALAAVLTVALAGRERRRGWYLALVACLAVAALCGLMGAFRSVSSSFGC
jgi:hypothetical protein